MYKLINLILSAAQWLSAAACLYAVAMYADEKLPMRYAWCFGMVLLVSMIIQIKIDRRCKK